MTCARVFIVGGALVYPRDVAFPKGEHASKPTLNSRSSLAGDHQASTSSGHGTIVDFTVFIAMASATARETPSSVKG